VARFADIVVVGVLVAGVVAGTGMGAPRSAAAAVGDGQAPAGPGPDTWTVEAMTFEVMTGPDDDLAVTIDADLYVPSSATAATPAPSILTSHGFGNHKAVPEQKANSAYFASHGYVVLSYSAQGFGASSSCIGLDSLDYDVKSAVQLLDFLGAHEAVAKDAPGDPKVGLIGGSYGGGEQGLLAVVDDRVDAIAVGRSWQTLQYSLDPNNWIVDPANPWDLDAADQGVFKQAWTTLFFSLGASTPAMGDGGCDPITQQQEFPGAVPCPGFVPAICPTFQRLSTTGDAAPEDRELVARSSTAPLINELDTPTLLVQGLPDTLFNVNEPSSTFAQLSARGVPVAMIWHSGGHGGFNTGPGEAEAYNAQWDDTPESQAVFAKGYLPRRTLQWFERHVRGEDVDTGPAFAWWRDWVEFDLEQTGGTAAPAYGTADTFPPPQVPITTWTLDPANDALVPSGGEVMGGEASLANPPLGEPAAYSEIPNFSGPSSSPGSVGFAPPTEIPTQHAVFDTPPFEVDTEFVGVPRASLRLSHLAPTGDVRFFLKIYDVDPDGGLTLLRRQVAPARVPDAALEAGPVGVHAIGNSWLFRKGHSLRIVVATTDQAYYNQKVADAVTLSSTGDAPSTIDLPLRSLTADDPMPLPAPPPEVAPPPPAPSTPVTGGGFAIAGLLVLGLAVFRRR
jgi:ABC-2 type transport system ATP-binding protein